MIFYTYGTIIYSLLVPCGSSVNCLMLQKMLQQFQEKDLSS